MFPIIIRSSIFSRLGFLLLSLIMGAACILYAVVDGGKLILFDLFFGPLFIAMSYLTYLTWYEIAFYKDYLTVKRGPTIKEIMYHDISGITYPWGLHSIGVYTVSGRYRINIYVQKSDQIDFDRVVQHLIPSVRQELTLTLPYDLRFNNVWLGHGFLLFATLVPLFLGYYVPTHRAEFDLFTLVCALLMSELMIWVVYFMLFRRPVGILFERDRITLRHRIWQSVYDSSQIGRPVVTKQTSFHTHGWHTSVHMQFMLGREKISVNETDAPIPLTAIEKFILENYIEKK